MPLKFFGILQQIVQKQFSKSPKDLPFYFFGIVRFFWIFFDMRHFPKEENVILM